MKLPTGATSATIADTLASLCRAELLGNADVKLRASRDATASIGTDQRDQLLAACAAGEYVELVVDFLAYEQRPDTANRNFIRFADKLLPKMAKGGAGIPFLRDHDTYDLLARAGTILSAEHELDAKGVHRIRMSAKVTAPWAVEALLRGNIDRFSIHARPTGPVLCSACGTPVGESCWHFPGDRLAETTDENGKKSLTRSRSGSTVVQWIFTAAELVETSAVSVPAVPEARIETVRAAMLAARGINPAELEEPAQEETKMTTIALALMAAALGLPSTATADQVEAHARSQTARLSLLESANADQTRRLAAQEVQLSAIREQTAARECDEFIAGAVTAGQVAPGSQTEKNLRGYFAADAAGARELVKTLPRVTPAGQPRQSTVTPPAGAGTGAGPGPAADPATAELAAVEAEIVAQGARPEGVRKVLAQFGHANPAAVLAATGRAAFGLPGSGQ